MKILYCRVGWMKEYKGCVNADIPINGGKYNKDAIGYEAFNNLSHNGIFYGYVQPGTNRTAGKEKWDGQIHIEKLGADKSDESTDEVLIIWVATSKQKVGQYIVGWYQNATVYREIREIRAQDIEERKQHCDAEYKESVPHRYNISTKYSVVIPEENRTERIDGMGHSNIWYGNKRSDARALKYIESYKENMNLVDRFLLERLPDMNERHQKAICDREQFVNDYPVTKIKKLKLADYMIAPEGYGRTDTFCYRIRYGLRAVSSMGNATPDIFGIYLKGGTEVQLNKTLQKDYENDIKAAFKFVCSEIVKLIEAAGIDDYDAIEKCSLNSLFKYKLVSIYYPDKFIPVGARKTLDAYCECLGIKTEKKGIEKNQELLAWKNAYPITQNWDNHTFMYFCDWLWRSGQKYVIENTSDMDDPEAYETTEKKDVVISQKEDDQQELRDKEYPQKYTAELNISVSDWKSMLADPDIFLPPNIALMKRFYVEDNHATTLYELGLQDGVSHSSYIRPVVGLAKRVSEKMNLKPLYRQEGNSKKKGTRIWWRILFWGRRREDGRFEWKLQPNLAKALQQMYPDLDTDVADDEQEHKFLKDICQAEAGKTPEGFEFKGQSKVKEEPLIVKGRTVYPRDRQTAINALAHAHYICEIDKKHPVFIRRNSDKGYTEPHHLIPMAFQDRFKVSLDVEENIVSLCSNCHNQIHYGKDADKLLKMLYESRKKDLEKVGIKVTFDELIKMYHL